MKHQILDTVFNGKKRIELVRNTMGQFIVLKIINSNVTILFSSPYHNEAVSYYEKKIGVL
jgi:hypothetical protein